MAGDWIPIRIDLHEQPEVLQIAEKTGRSIHEVMGILLRFWSWISTVSENGKIASEFCPDFVRVLSRVVGADDVFWSSLVDVGWLKTSDGIEVPRFETWMSRGAKYRLKDCQRKKLERKNPVRTLSEKCPRNVRIDSDKTRTRGEESIEHHHPPPPPPSKGGDVCVDLTTETTKSTKSTEDPPSKARPANPPDPELERAWLQVPGRLKARRQARPIEDLGAYIATLRKAHRHPQDAFPWWHEEDPPPAAPSKERLCPGCQRPLERLSRRTGSDICLDCERRGDARKEAPF